MELMNHAFEIARALERFNWSAAKENCAFLLGENVSSVQDCDAHVPGTIFRIYEEDRDRTADRRSDHAWPW